MTGLHAVILTLALTGAAPDEPVLLEFTATWCGPCRQMNPVISRLIAKGYRIERVDFDQHGDLARRFGVDRIPCFVMTVGGRETGRVLGIVPAEHLEKMFADARRLARPRILPEPGGLPLRNVANTTPPLRPIPLPHKQAEAALALETVPKEPIGRTHLLGEGPLNPAQPPVAYANLSRGPTDADLISATVRLRVYDDQGPSVGTGTIIDAREGQSLILTCGHIFRQYNRERGHIEVDLFGSTSSGTVPGRLLAFDDQRDVGLLTIHTPGPVKTIPVAPRGYSVDVGDMAVNVGCNYGEDPTARHNKVAAIDKYAGPSNIEVAGLPVEGRSGGGLFSKDGYLIGVCNAADPQCNEGLYAALESIHQQLDEVNLSSIYEEKKTTPVIKPAMVAVEEPSMAKTMPEADPIQHLTQSRGNAPPAPMHKTIAPSFSPDEQRFLDEMRQRRAEGAEIICIVRTKQSTDAPSEVFLFENASPQLIEQLDNEGFQRR